MSDVIEGSVTPQVANAAVNAGGKLLKVVDMQLRYGANTLAKCDSIPLIPGARD